MSNYSQTSHPSALLPSFSSDMVDELHLNRVLLDVYIEAIEQQIEDKRFFIKQARDAIESLEMSERAAGSPSRLPGAEKWQNFLSRPMYFPERSDPIGLCVAFTSLVSRRKSSEGWLKQMEIHLDDIKSMIKDQQRTNHDMMVLLELLQHKMETPPIADNTARETPVQRNFRVRNDMENFIRDVLSFDLASFSADSEEQVYSDVMHIIRRLITYDTNLKATDFPHSTKGLLRLLLRGNLITLTDRKDGRYVKLIDFADSEVA